MTSGSVAAPAKLRIRFARLVFCLVCWAVGAAQQPAASRERSLSGAPQSSPAAEQTPPGADTKPAELPPMTDAKEIVRRSVEADHQNWERAQNYTCQQRRVNKSLGAHGEVKSAQIRTYDLNFYYGELYSKLIKIDDKPLSESEQKKEDEKLEKFLAKHRNESEREREKRLAKDKQRREEARAFLREIVNAFDFRLLGEEKVGEAEAYVIEATPRKDFHPTQPHGEVLTKVKGKLWIEKNGYNWVKAEAESIDTISFGLFLFRIHKGAQLAFQQLHLNDEVWLMQRFYVSGGARVALFKNEGLEQEDTFFNYKKFAASTRILPGVKEAPNENPR